MLNGKVMIIHFNSWIDKKRYYKMSYYPPYRSSRNNKVELNLANYATKDDVK